MDRSMVEQEIQELRRQFRKDSQAALNAFAERYGDPIRRVVRRLLRSEEASKRGLCGRRPFDARRRRSAGTNQDSTASVIARDISLALLATTPERGPKAPARETICGREFPTIG